MDRRHFLFGASALLAGGSALAGEVHRRVLLLVELKGGNDGMNTVVPYADPLYRRLRPAIGVPRGRTIQLDERVGLNGKLEPLMDAWRAGDLAIVQGVGYPDPNHSHFRSTEIWDTASSSTETSSEGWVSRAFHDAPLPADAGVDAIVVDDNVLPLTGPGLRTVEMQDADGFLRQAAIMKTLPDPRGEPNPALRHLLDAGREANVATARLGGRLRKSRPPAHPFAADGGLGRQLDLATRILMAGVPVIAVKVALAGFDTHADQAPTHERLLGFLAEGLATFRNNLIAAGLWDDVVVMTYSEFGRRAPENASGGTDHGTSAPQFIMGGAVRGGLHGSSPSLGDLQNGELGQTVDFRDVYSTLARGCWGRHCDFGQQPMRTLDFLA